MNVTQREPGRGLWAGKTMAQPRVARVQHVSRKRLGAVAAIATILGITAFVTAGWFAAAVVLPAPTAVIVTLLQGLLGSGRNGT